MVDGRAPRSASASTCVSAFSALLSRDGIVRVAEDADGPTTQYGGGELRDVVGRAADVDQPPPRSERHCCRRSRFAEDRVDHHVGRSPRPR